MNNGFLSQEEIDALLGGDNETSEESTTSLDNEVEEILTDLEKDVLGEVGNISMGSASTALSQIIGQKVNITTPVVAATNLGKIKAGFETPNIALDVQYTSGIVGSNLLLMKVSDAAVVANLMMGGDGIVGVAAELSEIEISAVSEAMNQMIGSAATSMATMFAREVNISPPVSKVCDDTSPISGELTDDEPVVQVLFKLAIGELVDSNIMQILPIKTARKIIAIMMGTDGEVETEAAVEAKGIEESVSQIPMNNNPQPQVENNNPQGMQYNQPVYQQQQPQNNSGMMGSNNMYDNMPPAQPVNVQSASFQQLNAGGMASQPQNIDLILDVPLEVSVVLGRSKLNIKDVLELGTGSLIELDKLTEEPVEVLINGKKVAYGEVVVVDENFGVRITNIVSNEDRIKSLGR